MNDSNFAAEMMESFNHLSIRDLLGAREQYHVFLTRHPNVVATAIGRYLVRKPGVVKKNARRKPPRTLANSHVDKQRSWPCVLVFVDKWQSEAELIEEKSAGAVIPRTLYLADGRAVPVCIVEAPRNLEPKDATPAPCIRFPKSVIAGGFPLVVDVQGREHMATVGCLVTDGSKYYGLTNRHVTGEPGREIYAQLGGSLQRIGETAADESRQLAKLPFGEVYPGWPGPHLSLNADIGLVDIDNLNLWRTDVFGVGALGPIADYNVTNLSLSLIGEKVTGFGAASGRIDGRISAFFYRYRAMGGIEYVSDYLIGPPDNRAAVTRHGDSGAILLLQDGETFRPFAIAWGAHEFSDGENRSKLGFALATGLGNVCRLLDVDLVRGWNLDQPFTWGKTGHFKIGYRAGDLVTTAKLKKLLGNNQARLGYSDADLADDDKVVGGTFTHDFVPLADVADIIWRTTRPSDESNHFCDIDEVDPHVFGGKSLLQLSLASDKNIDLDVWLDFDRKMDAEKPIFKKDKNGVLQPRPREGALPFRVWQMYLQMIRSLLAGKIDEFIVAGGTMAHYVGDACQPLHISFLHHGADPTEANVHSDYETTMIDKKRDALFAGVNAVKKKVAQADLIGPDGKEAAKLILKLMKETVDRLPPSEVLDVWRNEKGIGRYDRMWAKLGPRTIRNIAGGATRMAILWQSAWKHGNGNRFADSRLGAIPEPKLQTIYGKKTFVPSYRLSDIEKFRKELKPL